MKKEYTLSDVVEYFKKNQIPSFEEEIDNYGGYFITAARLAVVILAPTPVKALTNFCVGINFASLRISKLFSWLPDRSKYGKKGREDFAIKRYELSSVIYIKLLDIAILNSFKEILAPVLGDILNEIEFDEEDRKDINRLVEEAEKKQLRIFIDTFSQIDEEKIDELVSKIIDPLFPCLLKIKSKLGNKKKRKKQSDIDIADLKARFVKKSYTYFNIFLVNFTTEFPEFHLWVDIKHKKEIVGELKQMKKLVESQTETTSQLIALNEEFTVKATTILERIEKLNEDFFLNKEGFPSFESTFIDLKIQLDNITNKLDEKTKKSIEVHQKRIKDNIEDYLSDSKDIENIVYPRNKEIYIAQSFNQICYNENKHRRIFLTTSGFDGISEKGEDVGKFLLKKLLDPNSTFKPIIMLGNPGAGKSMFSKMFAEKLCHTDDFIPFLIRLRDVASSSTDVSIHINKGIAMSTGYQDANWLDLAQLFKERIPVVILDGFDELMQSSEMPLNNYIATIESLQKTALANGICLKIILTSRITVMQDASIPDGTTILKLNPFDDKRKSLWIQKWNSFQTKANYEFKLPNSKKIKELAQEPLLLFMLAIYDFPNAELQSFADDKNFNQSKLYDSLLNDFGLRQLKKEDAYLNAGPGGKGKEEELFRLRLGLIALLMFINDSTNKDIKRLNEELHQCELSDSKIKPLDVLTGFFFVHQNKSTTEDRSEIYNYEFLHKSFGEFLAADFLLKIAFKLRKPETRNLPLFRLCFGYNWLNKHSEIQRFLFEQAPRVFSIDDNEQERVIEDIQSVLFDLFNTTINLFPLSNFTIVSHKSKIEHLAIYSQNLIFLWLALTKRGNRVVFKNPASRDQSRICNSEENFIYLAQDRDETNQGKLHWKRMCNLWLLAGNYQAVAKLFEWIDVIEEKDNIILKMHDTKAEIINNLSQASIISCNDFNYIMSLFDSDNKVDYIKTLGKLEKIYQEKPELASIGNDSLIFRLGIKNEIAIIDFLIKQHLDSRQLSLLNEHFMFWGDLLPKKELIKTGERLVVKNIECKAQHSQVRLLNYINNRIPIILQENIYHLVEDAFERIFLGLGYEEERNNPYFIIDCLTLINNINESFSFKRFIHPKFIKELTYHIDKNIKNILHEHPQLSLEYIKSISKLYRSGRFYYDFGDGFFAELFENIFADIYYDRSSYSLFDYIKLIDELSEELPIEILKKSKGLSRFFRNISYKFQDIAQENPRVALQYINIVKKIHRKLPYKVDFNLDQLEKWRSDSKYLDKRRPLYYLYYLKLIDELTNYFPIEHFYNSGVLDEIFNLIDDEFRNFHFDNPNVMFDYLKIASKFSKYKSNILFSKMNISEIVDRFLSDIEHAKRVNSTILLDILKLINDLIINDNSLKEIFRTQLWAERFIDLMKNKFKSNIRNNPELALECINYLSNVEELNVIIEIFPEFEKIAGMDSYESLSYLKTFINIFKK